jgi:hypothetical protein
MYCRMTVGEGKWNFGLHGLLSFDLCPPCSVSNATRCFGNWICYHLQVKGQKATTDLIKKGRAIPFSNPVVSAPDICSLWMQYPALKDAVKQRTHWHVDCGMCCWRNRILGTYLTYVFYSECDFGISCQGQKLNWFLYRALLIKQRSTN